MLTLSALLKGIHLAGSYVPLLNIHFVLKLAELHLRNKPSQRSHIFLMGPPRSGTTLLREILLQHSMINGPGIETSFFVRRRFDNLALDTILRHELQDLIAASRSKVELFDRIADHHLAATNGQFFLEKTATHFLSLHRLLQLYPRSKVIFIYRDGRDAFVSARRFADTHRDRAATYPSIWVKAMRTLAANATHPNVLPVRYEQFCEDAGAQMQRILAHVGLSYEGHLLEPGSYSRTPIAEQRNFSRLKEPIGSSTVGIHRDLAHARDVALFESVASAELRQFGYI